jgi:uncharacterized membrane protein
VGETYTFNLVIENTGNADCTGATYQLEDADSIVESKPTDLKLGTIEPGRSKTLELTVRCPPIQKESEFKKIGITITDPINKKTWKDSVSLKFHKETVNLYIRSNNPVYGIVIAPNGGKTYSVLNVTSETFTFPSSSNDYLVVFSGATADTETTYSFGLNVMPDTNWTVFSDMAKYEPNDKEADAPQIGIVPGKIMAYLHKNDIDYYRVNFDANAPQPTYGISLNPETWTFPAATAGYGAQTAKSVAISNTGNQPTGNLTLALSDSTAFTLSATSVNSLAEGGTDAFTVTPKKGLAAGAYTATVTVNGGNDITAKSFNVSFTVNAAAYGISLNPEMWTFPAATAGYGAQAAKSVTISNTGNQPTGALTLALSNSTAFTLSSTAINSIAAGGTDAFTVTPKTGLAAGTYSATVTVSGASVTSKSFSVSWTVNPAPVYGISLTPETWTFPAATAGYGAQTAKTVTITNTGNQPTGALTLALSNSTAFTLSSTAINSIAAGGTDAFTVTPRTGLAAGSYSAIVTVSGGSVTSKNFSVSWTVAAPAVSAPTGGWTSLASALAYLDSHTDGNSVNNPVPLKMNVNIASATDGWVALANALANRNKYIALDLSSCSMNGTEFDLYAGAVAGKNYIMSLVLPDAATSIASSSYNNSTYNNNNLRGYNNSYSKLSTISGVNVIDIGDYDFFGCTALTSVFFSKATSIGNYAFACTSLTTVSFPKVTTIESGAFMSCRSLTTLSFPEATTIEGIVNDYISIYGAFAYCTALTTISFPKVTFIGGVAFANCTSLTSVSFPDAIFIGGSAFAHCSSLPSAPFPKATSIGDWAFSECYSLASVSFPEVTTIELSAFILCTSLTTVSFPETTSIGFNAFRACTSLTSVSFPKVTSIGTGIYGGTNFNGAFAYCSSLATVSFPEATSIGIYAFIGCTSLTTADFPKVTTIGDGIYSSYQYYGAFSGCTSLTSVSFPKAISIGSYAFANSGTTPLVLTMGTAAPTVGEYIFRGVTGTKNVTVRVPNGATGYNATWQNAFKGKGNAGAAIAGTVNSYINLVIEYDEASIALSQTGTHTFPAATAGYGAQTAKSVTVSNSGNQPTGNLTLALSNSTAFTLSATAINSIGVNGSNSFTVTPKTGLSAGTYSATVTVSGGSVESKSFSVSFTVNAAPTYGISLTPETWTFPAATAGYGAQTVKSVTITNTGNQPTGNLTLALSNSTAFTLSTTLVNSIGANGSNSFTVTPKTGLSAGNYSATVTVSGGTNITSKSFSLSFTVNAAPTYGISLNPETWTFPSATVDYGAQAAKSVTVTNTGNQPTGALTIALSGDNSESFSLSTVEMSSIAADGSNTFTVEPNTGLAEGTYTATVTVSGGSVTSKNFSLSFTVRDDPVSGFTILANALEYLDSQTGGSTVDNPVSLKMKVNLASSTDGFSALVTALASKNKYVALDLSSCSMSGTAFDLYAGTVAGKNYIVSLALPDSATSIASSSSSNSTYTSGSYSNNSYSKLSTISGANVDSIGAWAFAYCIALIEASFPKATSIGNDAFYGCTALTTIAFPAATSIGGSAFWHCDALTTVSFPKATSTGDIAFSGCTSLTTVNFPKATAIGQQAFYSCTSLATVSFPEATSIGGGAFYLCASLTTISFPKVTSIGNVAFAGIATLTSVSFPEATTIGTQAFRTQASLTTVSFPKVTTIGDSAFWNCTALTTASFPKATNIGYMSFSGCTSLNEIFIPKAAHIERESFSYNGAVPLTITMGSIAPTFGENIFYNIPSIDTKNVTIRVPNGATGYSTWQNFMGNTLVIEYY